MLRGGIAAAVVRATWPVHCGCLSQGAEEVTKHARNGDLSYLRPCSGEALQLGVELWENRVVEDESRAKGETTQWKALFAWCDDFKLLVIPAGHHISLRHGAHT